jgi:hypothetical protein
MQYFVLRHALDGCGMEVLLCSSGGDPKSSGLEYAMEIYALKYNGNMSGLNSTFWAE